ncbi:MAG: hypothetical protein FMNOHCHN_02056 [Ignavibacteriaceae bacterium]|nr:hypothetical protein [Ignavibacteriaceae bacterium]
MNEEKHRPELIHSWHKHCSNQNLFFEEIDKTGGWPVGFKFVSFYHGDKDEERVCKFGNLYLREPWWTTICDSDEYYFWKLSDSKKKELVNKVKQELINSIRNI